MIFHQCAWDSLTSSVCSVHSILIYAYCLYNVCIHTHIFIHHQQCVALASVKYSINITKIRVLRVYTTYTFMCISCVFNTDDGVLFAHCIQAGMSNDLPATAKIKYYIIFFSLHFSRYFCSLYTSFSAQKHPLYVDLHCTLPL